MTDIPDEEFVRQRAEQAVAEANRISVALLVAAGKQIRTQVGSPEHIETTDEMRNLATLLTSVEFVPAEGVVFALARASAALLNSLADGVGVNPVPMLETWELNLLNEQMK